MRLSPASRHPSGYPQYQANDNPLTAALATRDISKGLENAHHGGGLGSSLPPISVGRITVCLGLSGILLNSRAWIKAFLDLICSESLAFWNSLSSVTLHSSYLLSLSLALPSEGFATCCRAEICMPLGGVGLFWLRTSDGESQRRVLSKC